jgi:hypothetical protein
MGVHEKKNDHLEMVGMIIIQLQVTFATKKPISYI